MREAVKQSPKTARTLNNSAWFLATCEELQFRDPPRAVELAEKAFKTEPEGNWWNTLGVALCRVEEWKKAIEALQTADEFDQGQARVDLDPDKTTGHNGFFLAMAHWQLGNKDEAKKWYQRAVRYMDKHDARNEELGRFRAEAEELFREQKN
jgi:tetratricopeptide (TPR) repeat protein